MFKSFWGVSSIEKGEEQHDDDDDHCGDVNFILHANMTAILLKRQLNLTLTD